MAFSSGEDWKNIRTFMLCTLRELGFGKRSLQSRVRAEVEIFLQEVDKNINKPFDIAYLTQISVSNIICSLVFGERFDYNDPEFIQRIDDMNEANRINSGASALNFFPFLRHIPGDFFNIKRVKTLNGIQNKRNEKHVEAHAKNLNPDEPPRDFIDALLIARKTNDWLRGRCFILMVEVTFSAMLNQLSSNFFYMTTKLLRQKKKINKNASLLLPERP